MWTALSPGENKHQRSLILSVIIFHDDDDDDDDNDDDDSDNDDHDDDDGDHHDDDDDDHLVMEALEMEMALAEPAEAAEEIHFMSPSIL